MRKNPTSILYPELIADRPGRWSSKFTEQIVADAGTEYKPLNNVREDDTEPHYHAKIYCDGYAVLYPDMQPRTRTTKRGKGGYDRKNNISRRGYVLRSTAKRKITSTIFCRFWKTKRNKYNRLKFFTFTVQASAYEDIVRAGEGLLTENERTKLADQYFIKCLSKCFENKSKTDPVKGGQIDNYVWVAEKTKRGIIHFHCVIETAFLDVKSLSSYWSKLCGMEDHRNSVHFGFEKHGRFKQVHIRSPKKLANYLTKYISKGATTDKEGEPAKEWKIFGRAYGMSRGYSQAYEESYEVIPFVGFNDKFTDDILKAKPGGVYIFRDKYGKEFEFSIHYFEYYSCLKGYFPEIYKRSGHRELGKQKEIPILVE